MTPSDQSDDGGDGDAYVAIETGRRGQRLICEGWFASHGDGGTPGPHLHLRTSNREAMVLRTDQVPAVISALETVAERIERKWAIDGDQYAADVVLRHPDPQDPHVVAQRRQDRLRFTQAVRDNIANVTRLLTEANSTDEALVSIAALLGVDEVVVMAGLAQFDLLALTRPATERRLNLLSEPLD